MLTIEGTAYFAESGRSQFLSHGWVLAKRGPLTGQIKIAGDGKPWRVLVFSGSNEFTAGRMAYVARHMGKIHKIPLNSRCGQTCQKIG